MNYYFKHLKPSSTECIGLLFSTILIVLIGNAKDLIDRYGLSASSSVIQSHVGAGIGNGLGKLDSFSVTTSIVNFGLWAMVGLISLSVLQSIIRVTNKVSYEKSIISNKYVHPDNFTRRSFAENIILSTATSFALLFLLVIVTVLYLKLFLDHGFTDARKFLLHVSVSGITDLLLGFLWVFVGTFLLYFTLKLVVIHHQRTDF